MFSSNHNKCIIGQILCHYSKGKKTLEISDNFFYTLNKYKIKKILHHKFTLSMMAVFA